MISLPTLLLVSPDLDTVLFVLDLHMKYTVEVVHVYIYYFLRLAQIGNVYDSG